MQPVGDFSCATAKECSRKFITDARTVRELTSRESYWMLKQVSRLVGKNQTGGIALYLPTISLTPIVETSLYSLLRRQTPSKR